ncbi:MAG TPA: alpha/beta hydrolase [Treponemataceae bacterium]|nr:alpha/beta hydrolase [Treponemataceae bacterium]
MEVTINGATTTLETFGEGIPIVSLHGWGCDRAMMKGCLEPAFSGIDGFRRAYFDLPGMGTSKVGDKIGSSDDMLDFALGVIDRISPSGGRFALVGKSYGGYLAKAIAARVPERFLGLLLVCPAIVMDDDKKRVPKRETRIRQDGIERIVPKEDLADFELFQTVQTAETWARYRDFVLPGARRANQEFLSGVLGPNKYLSNDPDRAGFAGASISPDDTFPFPTLMLTGKRDWCVGYEDAYAILRRYPRSTYAAIDNAGHNLEFEYPELFTAHVRGWLADVARYAGA